MYQRSGSRTGFTLTERLRLNTIIAILAAILFPVFCHARTQPQSNGVGTQYPVPLPPDGKNRIAEAREIIIGLTPDIGMENIAKGAKPLSAFLTKEIGVPVRFFVATDFTGQIEAMAAEKVDVALLPPLAYMLAKKANGAQVLLKLSRRGSVSYRSLFVARADSGIKNIGMAKGKRMAFVDPTSASGYLYPAAYLKGKGYNPDTFFSATVFTGSHKEAVLAVYKGNADVAACYDNALSSVEKTVPNLKKKVVKIGSSTDIPNDVIVARKNLDPLLVAKLKTALLKYSATDEGKKALFALYEADGLAPAKDADYDIVCLTATRMGIELP